MKKFLRSEGGIPLARTTLFKVIALTAAMAISAQAEIITWTNTAGGFWSVSNNWSPNEIPGSSDTALMDASGSYIIYLDTNATVQTVDLGGGYLAYSGSFFLTVTDQLNWTNGTIGCVVNLASNAVMTLDGTEGVDYTLAEVLTNAGTVDLASGNLLINYCGGNNGYIYNLAGALLDFQGDSSIDESSNQFGLCPSDIFNYGTIRKSGGAGTSVIRYPVVGSGTVDVQSGTLSLSGGGNFDGLLQSEGTGALVLASNVYGNVCALNGNLTSTNAFLAGGNWFGTGTISGVLSWTNSAAALTAGNGELTVGTNGLLVLAGTVGVDYDLDSGLINEGTILLASGNLELNYCGENFGGLTTMPGSLVEIQNDVSIDASCGATLNNQGTLLKSSGAGNSAINAYLDNSGTVIAETGALSLNGGYNLTGGTLDVPISGPATFGQIILAGNATLTGTLNVTFDDGYLPANGASFMPVTYGSETGYFSPLELPPWIAWRTNYGATALTITVSNSQPALTAQIAGTNGFTLQFLGNPNGSYTVVATTNLAVPLSNWTAIGAATLLTNDLFQYVAPNITNYPERFYDLRSP